jgi:hypothetical protein
MPFARYEYQHPDTETVAAPKEERIGGGLAWWIKGHTSNLKVQFLRVQPSAPAATLKDYNQVNVQLQLFFM